MRHARLLLAFLIGLALCACSATAIVPPPTVSHPAKAAVLDHGRHSSLLLEMPGGSVVRYAFGEWQWYALGRTGAARALGALFSPSEAALGRQTLAGPLTREAVRAQVGEGFEHIFIFEVESERALALARRLDALFEAGAGRMVYNPGFDLQFVPVPQSYWLGRNSNLVMAEWLEELGVGVERPSVLSDWLIERPAGR